MEMMNLTVTRGLAAALILCSAGSFGAGCGAKKSAPDYEGAYRLAASGAMALRSEIEPLRGSRLGITAADSLLFTYSEGEIREALKRLKRLEAQMSKIPAGSLRERDVDHATVIIGWARGARFAFEDLQSHRSSPLLYCSTAEEALWGIPSRVVSPASGEVEAYRKRIMRIPVLLSNGRTNLRNPADWHVRCAIERLDTIAAGLPGLAALVRQRYGQSLDKEIETVRLAIVDFRAFASGTLLSVSHGRIILGSENLSKIFGYGELINADPNTLVIEAENHMKRLATERASILKRFELERRNILPRRSAAAAAGIEPFEARIERIRSELRTAIAEDSTSGTISGAGEPLVHPARLEYLSQSEAAFYFSIPPAGDAAAASVTFPFSAPDCRTYLAVSAAAARMSDDALRFALLRATPRMIEPDRLRCKAADSIAAVFSSATFGEGWRYLALQEFAQNLKRNSPELYLLVLDDWKREFARMVVVLTLHAGTRTSDGAEQYLVENLGIQREEAAREVLTASVSPAIAYPAISMILVEDMLKNVSFVFGYGKPQQELEKTLRQSRDLPLSLIVPKTQSD
jgi:hypothetical protein